MTAPTHHTDPQISETALQITRDEQAYEKVDRALNAEEQFDVSPPQFSDISFVCCRGPVDPGYCMCSRPKSTLRRYAGGEELRPMTDAERDWCVGEINKAEAVPAVDGFAAMNDQELAEATLHALHPLAHR